MSSYQPSMIGAAGGLLQAAGNLFGGVLGRAGSSSYEIQRAIGGPAHDRALQQAVAEVKQRFRQCQRCGSWVCAEICWNERAGQCTGCTPKYEQEVIALRTQAQVQATQQQLQEKAMGTDYVSGIDMNPDARVALDPGGRTPRVTEGGPGGVASAWQTNPGLLGEAPAERMQKGGWEPVGATGAAATAAAATCGACGSTLHGSKFCPQCGASAQAPAAKTCGACGHVSPATARFCEECGGRLA